VGAPQILDTIKHGTPEERLRERSDAGGSSPGNQPKKTSSWVFCSGVR